MVEVLYFIAFFSFPFGSGAIWLVAPTFIIYPVVHRIVRGTWYSLYSWIDFLTFCVVDAIWYHGILHDFNYRGAGRLYDIVILGALYGIMITMRIPFVWRHPEWRTKIALVTFGLLLLVAIVITYSLSLASGE